MNDTANIVNRFGQSVCELQTHDFGRRVEYADNSKIKRNKKKKGFDR